MQTSSEQAVGCIGKCISGLSTDELDQITDNINRTLNHPRGREIFRKYLERRGLTDNLECLALYETCAEIIEEEKRLSQGKKEPSLDSLIANVTQAKEMAEDLDGVPQIDFVLLERFNEALNSDSRTTLLNVMVDTKDRCRDHLKRVHGSFKRLTRSIIASVAVFKFFSIRAGIRLTFFFLLSMFLVASTAKPLSCGVLYLTIRVDLLYVICCISFI